MFKEIHSAEIMRNNKAKITEKGKSQKGVMMIFTCIFF